MENKIEFWSYHDEIKGNVMVNDERIMILTLSLEEGVYILTGIPQKNKEIWAEIGDEILYEFRLFDDGTFTITFLDKKWKGIWNKQELWRETFDLLQKKIKEKTQELLEIQRQFDALMGKINTHNKEVKDG